MIAAPFCHAAILGQCPAEAAYTGLAASYGGPWWHFISIVLSALTCWPTASVPCSPIPCPTPSPKKSSSSRPRASNGG